MPASTWAEMLLAWNADKESFDVALNITKVETSCIVAELEKRGCKVERVNQYLFTVTRRCCEDRER